MIYVIGPIEGCLKAKPIIEKENPFPLRLTKEKGWILPSTESDFKKEACKTCSAKEKVFNVPIKVHLKLYLFPITHNFFGAINIH
jgi:hypothetical protein